MARETTMEASRTSLVWRSSTQEMKNKEYVKEQKFDDDPNSVKATMLVEPCTSSLLATEIGMRISRMGESRRRTKRMSLDMASSYRSPYDAPQENYLGGTPTPVILHEDDIFPGNTRHLSRLRVKKIASEFDNHAPAKLGNLADRQQPQERSKLRKLGRSFSRHDTRSMKKLPRAPSSLPASPLGNSNWINQETHATQIFHKLLRRSSRVNSEVSTRRETRSSWEPERERVVYKKHVSNAVVVWEKCSIPKRLGPIQGLQKTKQASIDASKSKRQNSWWPFKWKWKSKELRPQRSLNKRSVVLGDENKVDIIADHDQDIYHEASSDKLDSSPLSPNNLGRFTSAFNMIKERASSRHEESFKSCIWETSPFAPDQPCNPTRDAEKYLLPPCRLHK
ncbi:hypothetical protein BDL97_10G018700 [Sphagnum fallax]|nr:hypothetical protein BDL97_10G018700 [Sphagnum fallax]